MRTTRPFCYSFFEFFLRCFLNFLSSHVVLLHHATPPPRTLIRLRLLLLYVQLLVNFF